MHLGCLYLCLTVSLSLCSCAGCFENVLHEFFEASVKLGLLVVIVSQR